MGSHSLLQGIFPTQGSNPGLPHCRQILHRLSHQGSSRASQVVLMVKNPVSNAGDMRHESDPWVGKRRRAWQPILVFLPGESQGQRSLAGYPPQCRRVRQDWNDLAYSIEQNGMEVPQKTKNRITIQSSNSIPIYIYIQKSNALILNDTGTPMFIVGILTIAKIWDHLSVHWQMNGYRRLVYMNNGILLSQKKIEIFPFLPWLNMGGIMLCETSQRKANTTYYNLHVGI